MTSRRFEVDRAEGKVLGVCAGLANTTGVDATVWRIGAVLSALIFSFFWTVAFYVVLGVVGSRAGIRAGGRRVRERLSRRDREESRERMRDIDLRMQAIETYVTSSNSRLAREIEELR